MFITDRIKEYLKFKQISQSQFYRKTGLSNGSLSAKNIRTDNLEAVISTFEDLSLEWLVAGKGSMLKEQKSEPTPEPQPSELLRRFEELAVENAMLKREIELLKTQNQKP